MNDNVVASMKFRNRLVVEVNAKDAIIHKKYNRLSINKAYMDFQMHWIWRLLSLHLRTSGSLHYRKI